MRFGPVPLAEAEGHVLAHSVPLGRGRLRKGKILGAADIAALREAGREAVTVARLDPGDVHENVAAMRLATAIAPDAGLAGLRLSEAFTGRVNLIADHPGIARIDVQKVDAVNAVDPMITLATVPRWQRMDADHMVATVKIISYGVAGTHLEAACDVAAGAVAVQPPMLRDAVLIETLVADDPGDKGWRMTAARLDRLGVTLAPRVTVAHAVEPLAAQIARRPEALILILTGSATSDPHDIAPEAVRRAGGSVEHFGMPVDPGNLMFLGRVGERQVIGLPGSARSPALSGVDWVMERVICGLEITAGDIARMGVGGLLKEIPTRPQPRAGR